MSALYTCCDARRRSLVRAHPNLNGIDFLEVDDDPQQPSQRQRTLRVRLLNHHRVASLTLANLRIDGGERVRSLKLRSLDIHGDQLTLGVDRPGDFSRYTLRLVQDPRSDAPPPGFDPQLAAIEFSFKVNCAGKSEFLAEFDCAAPTPAPADDPPAPQLDYLARDYAGFRRLLLDRVAALVPGFVDRGPADPGVTVLELLADAADQLAYQQDALASEAYLATARRRVSVRRHARLVDYFLHDGCNARTFAQILVDADLLGSAADPALPAGTPLTTAIAGLPARLPPDIDPALLRTSAVVFETVHPLPELRRAHVRIDLHTWSCERCSLPRGSTRATLRTHLPGLHPGDVLILEELLGPRSGRPEDHDPGHRHPVRLTGVRLDHDPLDNTPITEVTWSPADALPFDLVIATPGHPQVAVARGNIVLCDHGASVHELLAEPRTHLAGDPPIFGALPAPSLRRAAPVTTAACGCDPAPELLLPARFRPVLTRGPLTHAAPHDPALPASAALRRPVGDAVPAISLVEPGRPEHVWRARRDLLGSGPDTLAFTVEIEADQSAALRFGDNVHARRPRPGVPLEARYRVGNGRAGQIGADALRHIVHPHPAILGVRNPLAAAGGVDPEDHELARLRAPHAFLRNPERAVTADDHAALASELPTVQRAVATHRWTGSYTAVVIDIDRVGAAPLDAQFTADALAFLRQRTLTGHHLRLREPIYVAVELELHVCAAAGYFRSDVRAAVQLALRRFFDPDNFSFGQPLHASAVIAAAQAVPGVSSVTVTLLRRQGDPSTTLPPGGALQVGPREILRLNNDPNFAERGVLRVDVGGGK